MKLGVFLSQDTALPVAREAERLGYAVALVPEGFKCDAPSVLGAVAAGTDRIRLASGVMQIPARTPVLTALTSATLHALSGGRFALGLGVSNPDVSHGWYGVPFDRPLARTRDYLAVVRTALRGEPVRFQGPTLTLPPAGVAEAAHLRGAAVPADVPIWLAAVGPANLELAGEVADGWIGVFCPPSRLAESLAWVGKGRDRAGLDMDGFEVLPSVPVAATAEPLRHYFANFIGLGGRERSIYHRLVTSMGYGDAADEIRRRIAAGDRPGAAAAVPDALVGEVSLLGDAERMAARMVAYAAAGVTTLGLTPLAPTLDAQLQTLRTAARALEIAGV
jgi:F420-dependent oxidoreductase-like protein